MAWQIKFTDKAERQFSKLPKEIQLRVKDLLYKRLKGLQNPRQIGEALKGELNPYWKYRIGKYRLIAEIIDGELLILVIKIEKRESVYKWLK